ncbi:MAG: hypothetical protein EZS28_012869 [Streblomastix strix]|uniref:Uncharacterized protein n=1 Tax=Streblomastix strix TaxID=222440 RepID=A0A5J4WB68_9EUKA|nr:MAG: hypothetical protein EZS28_012869 [Streblomastix strix]
MNRQLMKTHISKSQKILQTIENLSKTFAIQPFQNDGEHHFSIKEIKPESQMPSLFDKEVIISLSDSDHDVTQMQNSFITLDVRKDDKSCCGRYLSIKEISDVLALQTASSYAMPVGFTVSIPLDDLLIFSAFSEYPNSLFGDLKIKFKINPSAFVFCQVDPIMPMAKYYTINKDELLSSDQDQFKDIDLFFRNWRIRAEQLTPSGLKNLVCDIKPVTVSVRNQIIESVKANMCGYKASETCLNRIRQFYSTRPFVVPAQRIESWVFPSAASSTGIKTTQNIQLSHVTDMCLLFPKDARHVTCYENPCYFDMIITTMNRNFPNFEMNTLSEQFFTMQLQAKNLDNIFEACDEYEDSLVTPRASKTRRYNPVNDYTLFFITKQCEGNSNGTLTFDGLDSKNQNTPIELQGHPIFAGEVDTYYNVDTYGKHPFPPILCIVHDTFWLFSPRDGGSCLYDSTHSFEEVIGQVTA